MVITKEQFLRYENVRRSGKYNMIMDSRAAANSAGLSMDDYFKIQEQYTKLKKEYLNEEK